MPSVCVVMASGGLSGQLRQGQTDSGTGRSRAPAEHESLPRRHRQCRGPNRHQRRPGAGRYRLGEGLAHRPRRRLCGRGHHPLRGRSIPPRHRQQGAVLSGQGTRRAALERGWGPEIRRPKTEIRRKPRNPNPEPRQQAARPSAAASFGLRFSDFLRISTLGFRIWPACRPPARPRPRRCSPGATTVPPPVYPVWIPKSPLFAALFHSFLHSAGSLLGVPDRAVPRGQ